MMADMGTAINMPAIPQMYPQNNNESNITTGCNPKFSPSNFGSTIFPMKNCVEDNKLNININENPKLNCKKIIGVAAKIAIMDPILGMKLRKKVMVARSRATSTLKINNRTKVMSPVRNEVKNFVAMYRVILDSTSSSMICLAVSDFSPIAINSKNTNTNTMLLMMLTTLLDK
jgi:hypothetical protein